MGQMAMLLIISFTLVFFGWISSFAAEQSSLSALPPQVLWAGHQVVFGHTRVPFRGSIQTRTDTFVLAQVTQSDRQVSIEQVACDTIIHDVASVSVKIPKGALKKMPPACFRLMRQKQKLISRPWTVGWKRQDVDKDGFPGMTVEVDAPLCEGQLHVASQTTSRARGKLTSRGMTGSISVHVKQQILGADSLCLRWFAKDSDEYQKGVFAYREVSANATCDSLLEKGWPVRADIYRVSTLHSKGSEE